MVLSQAIEAFTIYLRANQRSPGTIEVYRRDLIALLRFAGDISLASLSPDLVHSFAASDQVQLRTDGKPCAQVTMNRTKAALRSFGSWMADCGYAARSPASGLEIRRTERRSPEVLTEAETRRMLRELAARKGEAAQRDRVMLEVLLGTGIRLAELVGLDLEDVDLESKRLTVHVKGGRTETRFIPSDLRQVLRRYLRHRARVGAETQALFLSSRGTRISTRQVQARFQQWLTWANITRPGLTVHSTRHTLGTRLYQKTNDLLLVGRALGHRTMEATRIYVHQDDDALEDALERV